MMRTTADSTSAKTAAGCGMENSGISVVFVVVKVTELAMVTVCENPVLGSMVIGGPDFGLAVEGAQAYVPGAEG